MKVETSASKSSARKVKAWLVDAFVHFELYIPEIYAIQDYSQIPMNVGAATAYKDSNLSAM